MMHAPVTPHARTTRAVERAPARGPTRWTTGSLGRELRRVLAGAGGPPASTCSATGRSAPRGGDERVDALVRELVARMRGAGWDEAAAPCAVTSVLAASVPEAETVLLRAARARR